MSDVSDHSIAASAPVQQPLRFRVLDSLFDVSDVPAIVGVQLAEVLRPFLVSDDTDAVRDAPALTFSAALDESSGIWQILSDGEMVIGVPTEEAVLLQLEWRITAAGLGRAEGCGVFHAGALTRDGATVLLQGVSGAGKTTLTLGLIARGWLPLADDSAVVDIQTLGMRVFPRCFHVEHPDKQPVGACPPLEHIAPVEGHARPLRWASEGGRPTAIITIARDPEQPSSLTPLLRAETASALLYGAIGTQLTRSQVASLAARIASTVRYCGHLNNSDLSTALDLVEKACAQ